MVSMESSSGASPPEPGDGDAAGGCCYALVAYIPEPLGSFLDEARRALVPGCCLRSHVSILPPRRLAGSEQQALEQIRETSLSETPFELELGPIDVFPSTSVIYISLAGGSERLFRMHEALNREALEYYEPFEYYPHLTLAQEIPLDAVPETFARARKIWSEYPHERRFAVRALTFVRTADGVVWHDLAECAMSNGIPAR